MTGKEILARQSLDGFDFNKNMVVFVEEFKRIMTPVFDKILEEAYPLTEELIERMERGTGLPHKQ